MKDLIVGQRGTGLLFVTGGGTLVTNGPGDTGAGTALIGGFLGGDAVATVDGVGSTWTNTGRLSVGLGASGTLLVGNGATVSSDLIQVGAFTGSGALVISTGATVSTGMILIDGGTLTIGGATAIPVAPGTLTTSLGVSFGPGVVGRTVVFNHTSNNYVFGSPITGDGSVIVENGTTILTGASTYTGGTTIAAGTVSVSSDGNLGNTTGGLTFNGGALQVTGTTFNSTARTITWGAGGGGFDIDDAANNFTVSQALTGGPLTKSGAGTLTLSGANTYAGATSINGGTLALSGSGSIAASSGVADNGTFDISAAGTGVLIKTLSGTGKVTLGANTLTLSNGSSTFSGAIGGSGGLTLTTGTETLSGTNTYTGATTIIGGTLALSGNGSIATSSGVSNNFGTFDISAASAGVSIQTLSGNGTVTLGANTLTLSNASSTYSGAIAGSGGLTLTTGTETLSGTLSYQGNTTVNGGTLHVTNAFTVLSTATLTVNNTGTYTIDQLLTNSGAIQVNAGGTLIATAGGITNNLGATIVNNGRIDDVLNNAGTVTNNLTYNADVATNTGTIANSATGTWTGNVITNASNATGISNAGTWVGNVQANTGMIANTGTWTGTVTSSGTFNNNSPGMVSGLLTNSGTAGNGGTLGGGLSNTAGTMTNTGTINGGATVSGGTLNTNTSTSAINGGLTNTATVNAQGQVNGSIANNAGGTFNATGDLTGNSTFTNANGANLNVNAGTYTSTGLVTNNGALAVANGATLTSMVNGITNNATGTIGNSGTINALNLANYGAVTNNAGANYNSDLANESTGTVTNSGNWTGNLTSNANSHAGAINNSGTWIGNADNDAGALVNSGTWTTTTGFINGGTLTTTGTISGGLTNSATANALGTVGGAILNHGAGIFTVTAALAGNDTFTNNGTARLNVTGGDFTGITTLSNNSTAAAGIAIATGRTLSANSVVNSAGATIGNSGTLSSLNSAVSNAGTLNTDVATSIVNGGLTNTGTVTAAGQVDGIIANNGAGTFTVDGTLAGNNTFTNNGTAQLIVAAGSFTGITTLTNNSTAGAGIVNAAGRTLSANAIVNNAGATINNLGTITTNSMIDNGAITGAYAMADGWLSGIGSVQNLAVNGGTFAPGNGAPGSSMTVTGSLALQSGALFLVQINPAPASFANVTGTAYLGGATVGAIFAAGSYVSKQYTLVQATGTVSGTFNPAVVNTNLPSNFHTNLSYDTHDAYLNLALNFGIPGGLNGNQQNVGNALTNFFNATGGIPIVFGALTPAALTQASGEIATGSQQTTFDAMNMFMGVMTDPFIGGRGDGATTGSDMTPFAEEFDAANAYAAKDSGRSQSESDAYAAIYRKAPAKVAPFSPSWSVWTAGYGGSQTTDGSIALGSNTATSSVYGTAVGADYRISPFTIAGFALAGGGTNFSVANGGTGRSDLFQAGAFIRHTVGPAYISAALAYGWQDITTDRTVTIAGVDQLRAEFDANAFSGRAEGGYRFVTPWMGVTPYAAGQFTTFDLPAYAEQALSGANTFALAYGSKSVTDTRTELGIRTDKSYAMQDAILTLRGRLAWAHDYDPDRSIAATFQTLPGASFVVNGAAQASDSALTTASAELKWRNGWSAAATFEGEFSDVTRSYAGKGVVRYAW
ncbi:beta strand repeat-containing protein [Bradyrhizobium erythrophlei]|uniref:beta strand repeat-containing protein n=1 Tax=Bradyrhizobium erythrophlei TaxID=1437360 RepID=UPI0015614D8B|nr:autotransporter domain-containing protein [Bradyrhizobium erythrophlei]